MTRALLVVVASAVGFLAFATVTVTQLLSANLPCVSTHLPLFGGAAGHGNPCTRTSNWLPLPGWLLGALGATALLGLLVIGATAALRMNWQTCRLVAACAASTRPTSPIVARAAQRCGLEVEVCEVEQPVTAFCCGLRQPTIFIGSGFVESLDEDELEAILRHEAAHVRAHDPAGLLLARTLSRLLFFLPSIGDLARHHESAIEIKADVSALTQTNRRALAGALLKAAAQPSMFQAKDFAMGSFDPTAERLEHLTRGVRHRPGTTPTHLTVTLAAIALVAAGWWWVQPVARVSNDVEVVEVPSHPAQSFGGARR